MNMRWRRMQNTSISQTFGADQVHLSQILCDGDRKTVECVVGFTILQTVAKFCKIQYTHRFIPYCRHLSRQLPAPLTFYGKLEFVYYDSRARTHTHSSKTKTFWPWLSCISGALINLIKLLQNLMKLLPNYIMVWEKFYCKFISDIIVNDYTTKRDWNLDIYSKTLFCFIFNWSVYPLFPVQKVAHRPELHRVRER